MATYVLRTVSMAGVVGNVLENARLDELNWVLSDYGSLSFTLAANDADGASISPPLTEVQVLRDGTVIWWGVVIKSRGGDKTVTYQAVTLEWYFSRRLIGAAVANYFTNGSFESGLTGWSVGYTPYANPMVNPGTLVNTNAAFVVNGAQSLRIIPATVQWEHVMYSRNLFAGPKSTNLTQQGKEIITALAKTINEDNTITVDGHTSNEGTGNGTFSLARADAVKAQLAKTLTSATITTNGKGETEPWASNTTDEGKAANHRMVVKYTRNAALGATDHQQYVAQSWLYTNPVSSKRAARFTFVAWVYVTSFLGQSYKGRSLFIEAQDLSKPHDIPYLAFAGYGKVLKSQQVGIDTSLVNKWQRLECFIDIPADGVQYQIMARLVGPHGTSYWDEANVTRNEALAYMATDQASICAGLVQHAQSVAAGKSDLSIGTNCPATGVLRDREYEYTAREEIIEALNEFPTLADGLEWDIVLGATTRTFTTYYPRKGANTAVTLQAGTNIAYFDVDVDGEGVSTRVWVQAEGEGSDREEGLSSDSSFTGGVVFEKVYNATPGSAISSLQAQANRGLGRYKKQVIVPSITCLPSATSTLLTGLVKGDRCQVVISAGWISVNAQYRVTSVSLDPNTDMLTYTIVPE